MNIVVFLLDVEISEPFFVQESVDQFLDEQKGVGILYGNCIELVVVLSGSFWAPELLFDKEK